MSVKMNIKFYMDNLSCGMNVGQPDVSHEGKYFYTS